jgi:primosomal protein N'
MISKIQIGCLVRIPLGKRKVIGIVSSLAPKEKPTKNKLKNILSLVQEKPVLNENYQISKMDVYLLCIFN